MPGDPPASEFNGLSARATASAEPTGKPPLSARLKAAISQRQVAITLGVPGTSRTINGPLRAGVPGQHHAGVAGPPGPLGETIKPASGGGSKTADPVLDEARELLHLADTMAVSLNTPHVMVYDRPATSTARRWATTVIPWMKPTSIQDMASFTNGRGAKLTAPAPRKPPVISRDRAENQAQARALLANVEACRQALDDAVAELTTARAQYTSATAAKVDGTAHDQPLSDATTRLRIAEANLTCASDALREATHGTDLLELMSLSHLSDQADKHLSFSIDRLNDLKDKIYALRADAGNRREATRLALEVQQKEAEVLQSFDNDMSATQEIADQAQARLTRLKASHAAILASSPELTPEILAKAAVFERRIGATNAVLTQATEALDRCQTRLQRFAELNDSIVALASECEQAARQWQAADDALPSLHSASLLLAERKDLKDLGEQGEPAGKQGEHDAIDAARQATVEQWIEAAHVFGPQAPSELRAALRQVASRLTGPTPPIPVLPQHMLEIVTQALADVGADASEAARMLAALAQHPVTHWTTLAAEMPSARDAGPSGTSDDNTRVVALCRLMATLPRGTDMLHVLSSDGATAPDAKRSEALRVFWNADDAQHTEVSKDPGVAAWLQQAKQVAQAGLTSATIAFDDVDHAAYNAVRNGYLSNAPGSAYARHNERLMKAMTEWVIRAAASASPKTPDNPKSSTSMTWRQLMPHVNKTPFQKRTLARAYGVSESMGMQSPRIKVDVHVQRRMAALERTIAACSAPGATPEMQAATAAAQASVAHLKQLQHRGEHLSQIKLDPKDLHAIRRRIGEAGVRQRAAEARQSGTRTTSASRPPNLLRKAAPVKLPEFFEDVCGSGLSAYEAINRIDAHLEALLPPDSRNAGGAGSADDTPHDDGLDAAIRVLKAEHFGSKEDIVTFFQPFILNSRLRDRLRLGGGGSLGVNLPTLPYSSLSPVVSPIFTAEKSLTDEAFVQLFMPILGMELQFGAAHTKAKEATIGVAVGPKPVHGVAAQAALSVRAASQQTATNSTLLRFFRSRHKDVEMRANMLNALDSMVRWDTLEPQKGRAYRDPLEAIFARNPAVTVTQLEGATDTKTITTRLSGRVSARFADRGGTSQTLGVEAQAYAEMDRTRDKRFETGGQVRVNNAKGDNAQQRVGVALNANFSPLATPSVTGKHGVVQRQSVPMQLGISRDLAWFKEQHEISPFLIGDKQDGDLDRHYSTPTDMLKEITANREHWLMRCIETLDVDPATGQKDSPDNRMRAAELLEKFEQDIRQLGKTSKYCHYNVNYSMRGEASAWIDGYRAMEKLAAQRGDHEGVRKAQNAIDEILLMRATWRPLMLIVRERTRDATSVGWRSLLRWQRNVSVEGQRTAAQFPPP
ncbi:type III effector [Pandoraea anhela]|uniref:Type III effector n=1 Tax=Pandoraea anhela TaxID=2508295 RepID=A0A5E4RBS1_9BURK|nr:type III effector [Pandoraea anhela]VVD59538.1 hypothetical protein PAN31108_00034 [Pandoraea anhela]